MTCSACPAEKIFARGYCQACYYRLRRNGTVERKNVIRAAVCSVDGCTEKPFAKNLCKLHYSRQEHPLKVTWKLFRSRHPGLYPPEWDRFDVFLADVGERPSEAHKFKRLDAAKPFSKENFEWRPPQPKVTAGSRKAYHAAYGREWNMQTKFGITGEQYAAMLKAQGGVCAICEEAERRPDRRTGEMKALAIDHDHKTGKVRGLLCADCNTAIGLLDDDPELLRAAIAYLDAHAENGADHD